MHYHYAKEANVSRLPGFFEDKNQTPTLLQGIEPRFPYRNMASAFPLGDRSKVSRESDLNQRPVDICLAYNTATVDCKLPLCYRECG